jgi:hypothetical protein
MSGRVRRLVMALPLVLALWAVILLPSWAATAGAGVHTVGRTASFHTAGQSLWGRGAGKSLASDVPIFDQSWNQSGSVGGITTICILPDLTGGCITSADFGATLNGSTTGRVGLSVHYELGAGDLAIKYPVQVQFRMPVSFTPGHLVTMGSGLEVLPGAKITSVSPDGHLDLNGVFGFTAHAGAKACVVTCSESSTDVTIPTVSGTIFTIDNSTVHDFSAAELTQLGLSGSVQLPDLAVGATTIKPDKSLVASGSGEYANLGISAIEWGLKLAGIELPLNLDIPLCCSVSAGYTSFDSTYSASAVANQALRFSPTVMVHLRLPRALDYVVRTRSGHRLGSGHGRDVVFRVGNSVDLRIPADQTTPLRIVPSAILARPVLTNDTTTDISFGGEVKALEAHANVPADEPFFPGVNVGLGPVYDESYPIASLPTIDVWKAHWNVDGFSTVGMRALTLLPA